MNESKKNESYLSVYCELWDSEEVTEKNYKNELEEWLNENNLHVLYSNGLNNTFIDLFDKYFRFALNINSSLYENGDTLTKSRYCYKRVTELVDRRNFQKLLNEENYLAAIEQINVVPDYTTKDNLLFCVTNDSPIFNIEEYNDLYDLIGSNDFSEFQSCLDYENLPKVKPFKNKTYNNNFYSSDFDLSIKEDETKNKLKALDDDRKRVESRKVYVSPSEIKERHRNELPSRIMPGFFHGICGAVLGTGLFTLFGSRIAGAIVISCSVIMEVVAHIIKFIIFKVKVKEFEDAEESDRYRWKERDLKEINEKEKTLRETAINEAIVRENINQARENWRIYSARLNVLVKYISLHLSELLTKTYDDYTSIQAKKSELENARNCKLNEIKTKEKEFSSIDKARELLIDKGIVSSTKNSNQFIEVLKPYIISNESDLMSAVRDILWKEEQRKSQKEIIEQQEKQALYQRLSNLLIELKDTQAKHECASPGRSWYYRDKIEDLKAEIKEIKGELEYYN